MNVIKRSVARGMIAASLALALTASPVLATSFRQGTLNPIQCGSILGTAVAQTFPYGYTDQGRYWYISGLWSWTSTGGYVWQGWSDWYYLDPADAGEFIQTDFWHHYPDGATTNSKSWVFPSGTPARYYLTVNYLYDVSTGQYWSPFYSPSTGWLVC